MSPSPSSADSHTVDNVPVMRTESLDTIEMAPHPPTIVPSMMMGASDVRERSPSTVTVTPAGTVKLFTSMVPESVVSAGGARSSSSTTMVATSDRSFRVAVICTVPPPTPRTSPSPSTVAMASSDDVQVGRRMMGDPPASVAIAARSTVRPLTMVSAAGVTDSVAATWATVTCAVPDPDPDELLACAVMVAVPSATAVTVPSEATVATA